MRVLLVSNQASLRKTLRSYLVACGCNRLWEAKGADEGIEALDRLHPELDLIVVDHSKPDLDGFALVERMRLASEHGGAPILLLASRSRWFLTRRRRSAEEPDAFLPKPFRPRALLTAIARARFHRALSRNEVAVLGVSPRLDILVARARRHKGKFWGNVVTFSEVAPFLESMRAVDSRIGMVIVDTDWSACLDRRTVGRVRNYLRNAGIPVAIVRDGVPPQIAGDFILSMDASDIRWNNVFRSAISRVQWGWRLAQIIKDAKRAFQARLYRRSKQLLREAIKLDGLNAETLVALGDVLRFEGSTRRAREIYLRAQALDPRLPYLDRKLESVGG